MSEERDQRLAIWNSFLKMAWSEAKAVYEEANQVKSNRVFKSIPAPLSDREHHALAAVVLCNLAIEARANHLIEDLVENETISADVGRAVQRLPPKDKWFLIPTLAGVRKELRADHRPHQVIAEICSLRNDLMHVNYGALKKRLPKPTVLARYFKRFVEAMEDMNVVLGKGGRISPRQAVLDLGVFDET